ncbi:hypothetical protein [Amycolatopsis sp. WGS_07]|uniref:hypothetical protein n=1 Tax=Amycolatopsis sp. WGS_07 TaxID=3076764 RepID=UPI0038736538
MPRADTKKNGEPAQDWASAVDGWVRDPAIRRHALLALAMLLATGLIAVGIMTGLSHQPLFWLGGAGLGGAGLWIRRGRHRSNR